MNSIAPSESPLLLCHAQYWRIEGEARHEQNIYAYISIHYKMGLWMRDRETEIKCQVYILCMSEK